MKALKWHRMILPATLCASGVLFTLKAVNLAEAAAPASQQARSAIAGAEAPIRVGAPQPSVEKVAVTCDAPSTAELVIYQSLKDRRIKLEKREAELLLHEKDLAAREASVQAKLDTIAKADGRVEEQNQQDVQKQDLNWRRLVQMYEDMKPQEAAGICNVLDLPVLTEVLNRMDERKAAALLGAMAPERARLATQMLAAKRTLIIGSPSLAPLVPKSPGQAS